jgi:hypothetical protein
LPQNSLWAASSAHSLNTGSASQAMNQMLMGFMQNIFSNFFGGKGSSGFGTLPATPQGAPLANSVSVTPKHTTPAPVQPQIPVCPPAPAPVTVAPAPAPIAPAPAPVAVAPAPAPIAPAPAPVAAAPAPAPAAPAPAPVAAAPAPAPVAPAPAPVAAPPAPAPVATTDFDPKARFIIESRQIRELPFHPSNPESVPRQIIFEGQLMTLARGGAIEANQIRYNLGNDGLLRKTQTRNISILFAPLDSASE